MAKGKNTEEVKKPTRFSARIRKIRKGKTRPIEQSRPLSGIRRNKRDHRLPRVGAGAVRSLEEEKSSVGWNGMVEWNWRHLRIDGKYFGRWACQSIPPLKREQFYPGIIIMAMQSTGQDNWDVSIYDEHVSTPEEGPVYSKLRPMVALWATCFSLYCVPITSSGGRGGEVGNVGPDRIKELVGITKDGDDWKSHENTLGGTEPLHFQVIGAEPLEKSYIDLVRPVLVSYTEFIPHLIGRLPGDQYLRLMNLFEWRQLQFKKHAFSTWWQVDDYTGQPPDESVVFPSTTTSTTEAQRSNEERGELMKRVEPVQVDLPHSKIPKSWKWQPVSKDAT